MSPTPDDRSTNALDAAQPLTRRGMVTGAAWALPTIALAATVPVAAASEPPVCVLFYATSYGDSGSDSLPISFIYDSAGPAAIAAGMVMRITAIEGEGFDGIDGNSTLPQDFPVTALSLNAGRVDLTLTRPSGELDGGDVFVTVQQLSSGGALCNAARYSFPFAPPGG